MEHFLFIVIGLLIFGLHQYLSSRPIIWLGAIIPTILTIAFIIFFQRYDLSFLSRDVLPFLFLLFVFLLSWGIGYDKRKEREKAEIEKMKKHDSI